MSAPNPAPRGERQKANDQVDGEMNRFLQMVGAAHEQGMGVEALHAKIDDTNSALLKGFDEFILAAREGGLAKTERGEDWRKQGNDAFKKKSYEQAVLCYTRALHDLSDPAVLAAVLNNRATCLFHMELYRHAVVDAAEAVNLAPAYLKAYYRRGHALVKLGHTAEGEADIAITTPEDVATADESSAAAEGGGGNAVSAVEKVRAELASASRLRQATVVECGKVELKESFEEGRHLVARKTLNPGDVVVSEDAYAAGLRPEHLLTHCEWCLQHTPNIYTARHFSSTSRNPTSPSTAVRSRGLYCSADCAEAAMAAYVALEQTHPFFLICPLDCLVALRVMVARRQTSGGVETVNKLGGRTGDALPALLDSLEGHTHETEQTLSIGGNETANAVLAYHSGVLASVLLHGKGGVVASSAEGNVGSVDAAATVSIPELWEAANELRRTMQQLITNGVGVSKLLKLPSPAGVESKTPVAAAMHAVEQRKVATALFPHVALVNHSCDPNCFLNFEGGPHTAFRRVHLRVTRLISPGEQLTICYGPHKNKIHSAKNRREALQNQYSFLCHCASCHEELDEPLTEERQELMTNASNYYQKGRKMMRERRHPDAIPAFEASLDLLLNKIFIGKHRSSFVIGKTHDAAAECYATLGHYDKALRHCKQSVENAVLVNGACEISTAHEHLKLSGLAAQCGDLPAAKEALAKAEEIFAVFYGAVRIPEVEECREAVEHLSSVTESALGRKQ